jgi:hypothetical protein
MVVLTNDNWKAHRESEANLKFSIDDIVMYDSGFTRFDEMFGKVKRITKTGMIYVARVELEMVNRSKLEHPDDCQIAGWSDFNPKKVTLEGEILKFIPRLHFNQDFDYKKKKWNYTDYIAWYGPNRSGHYNLRPIVLDANGFARAKWMNVY